MNTAQERHLRQRLEDTLSAVMDAPLPPAVLYLYLERSIDPDYNYFLLSLDKLYSPETLDTLRALLLTRNLCLNGDVRTGGKTVKMHTFFFGFGALGETPEVEAVARIVRKQVNARLDTLRSEPEITEKISDRRTQEKTLYPNSTWRRDLALPRTQLPRTIQRLLDQGYLKGQVAITLTDFQWRVLENYQIFRLITTRTVPFDTNDAIRLTAEQLDRLSSFEVVNAIRKNPCRLTLALGEHVENATPPTSAQWLARSPARLFHSITTENPAPTDATTQRP